MNNQTTSFLLCSQVVLTGVLIVVGLNLIVNLRMLGNAAPRGARPTPRQLVSVLIPARNEARNIGRCLESLLAQDYPLLEILVLDDGSTDATASIVAKAADRHSRVRLITGQPLPQGWMGKNYACHQLAAAAQGEWLLFTDADTDHHPDTVAWAVHAAEQNRADLLSLIPRTVTHTLGEQLILPIIPLGVLSFFPLALGRYLRIPFFTLALGPFMLFRSAAYQRVGGHAAVQGEIAEDAALARRCRRAGGRVVLLDGSDQVDVHFYHGFYEAWQGLTKSIFAVLEYRILPSLLMSAFYGLLFVWPVVLLGSGLWQGRMNELALRIAVVQILLNAALCYTVAARLRLPRITAAFYPITILLTILMMLDSIRRAAFTGIPWKQRVYHRDNRFLRH